MSRSKILFQLSGSIACFKACAVLSSLVKAGHEVEVVATTAALQFVGEATLEGLTGRRVHTSAFESGRYMTHIHLMRWADVVVLCPASANTINKLSAGLADDLIGALFLAYDFSKPYLVVPAMNSSMYAHPATKASLKILNDWGVSVLETASGSLACGESGDGRMLEPDEIVRAISNAISSNTHGRRILITSGGTEEPIDGVRALTNTSSGKTGAELATWFANRGHRVTLLHARKAFRPVASPNLELKEFTSFASLEEALNTELSRNDFDVVIHLAAVADYSLSHLQSNGAIFKAPIKGKIDSADELVLTLKKNPKLVDKLRSFSRNKNIKVVAFKLTRTADEAERRAAVAKLLEHAAPDIVVHNDLDEIMNGDHPFTVYRAADDVDLKGPLKIRGTQSLATELANSLGGSL